MNSSKWLIFVAAGVLAGVKPSPAADLAKIERTIAKEPPYQSKDVKYCLLVFGPEAKTRIWLIQDGDQLFVDRNANGDLTEVSERVRTKPGHTTVTKEGVFDFEVGDIQAGNLVHKSVRVKTIKLGDDIARQVDGSAAKSTSRRGWFVTADIEMPGFQGQGLGGRVEHFASYEDAHGYLQFGATPQTAPIIHFGGPWHITLLRPQKLKIGRERDLVLAIGTRGMGPGTTAYVGYEGVVPEGVSPRVEIEYTAKTEGAPAIKELYELRDRC